MLFYLSKGNLRYLFNKKSNFAAANGSGGEVSGNLISLDFDKDYTVVQCKKIETFDSSVYGDLTLVTLNDGEDEKPAVILKPNGTINNLKNGSVILIRGISFHTFASLGFDISEESGIDIKQRVMVVEKFQLIGFKSYTPEESKEEATQDYMKNQENLIGITDISESNEEKTKEKDENEKFEKVMNINKLNQFSDNFILKVCIEKKTPISTFQSNINSHKIRAKLLDSTGSIELVAFHSDCKRIDELQINKWYLIDSICINTKNRKFSAWPGEKTVEFDLMVKNETNFYLTEGPSLEIVKQQMEELNTPRNEDIVTAPQVNFTNDTKINLNNFITIDKLARCKLNDMVNLIGIVLKVDGLTNKMFTDGRESIVIRNVTIIDKSYHSTILAFWGKDARNFSMEIGTPIVIKSALVTLFNGLTVSIVKKSTFYASSKSSKNEIVEIKEWYKNLNPHLEIPVRSLINKGNRAANARSKMAKKNY